MLVLAGLISFRVANAVVWICAGKSVDNPGLILLLLSSDYIEPKAFSAPHPIPPARSLGVHKGLEGDTIRTPTDQGDIP